MGVSGKLRELRGRVRGDFSRPLRAAFYKPAAGGRGLEIGGPSGVFRRDGLLPIYPVLASLDCVQWAARTSWHALDPAIGFVPDGSRTGELHIVDDPDLKSIESSRYDIVLSSHVIEHLANPLRALAAWKRVTVAGGQLLIVAPHMAGTFDHRRTLTPPEHLIDDLERDTDENDLTHVEEVMRLHDLTRDAPVDPEKRAAELWDNANTRILHHHTFTTLSLGALLEHAGLEIVAAEARLPHDIYLLARWQSDEGRKRRSSEASGTLVEAARTSPFRADRRAARRSPQRSRSTTIG
jgi:SAM-dependent methyltransferase